jgi:DNA-binding MarR family transcriptional regulator
MEDPFPEVSIPASVSDAMLRRFTGYNMKRACSVLLTDFHETLRPLDLRAVTFSALVIVVENPGVTQNELADTLAIGRPNIVVVIDELEARSLVIRARVPTDGRAWALRATLEGRRLCSRATAAIREGEARVLAELSPEEIATLTAVLSRIEAFSKGAE